MKKKKIVLWLLAFSYILAAASGVLYLSSFSSAGGALPKAAAEETPQPETPQETEPAETQTAAGTLAETETESAEWEEDGAEAVPPSETEAESDTPSVSFLSDSSLNINIRSGPDITAEIVGKIKPGTRGTVIELTDGEWALVSYDGITGYCARRCLILEEP